MGTYNTKGIRRREIRDEEMINEERKEHSQIMIQKEGGGGRSYQVKGTEQKWIKI